MPRFSKDCLSGHRAVTQAAACSPKANLLWQAVLGHIDLWGGHAERYAEYRCLLGMGVHRIHVTQLHSSQVHSLSSTPLGRARCTLLKTAICCNENEPPVRAAP